MEVNEEDCITNRRQRNVTNVRQFNCIWACFCSFKSVDKRGLDIKVFILTVQNSVHNCIFIDDFLNVFLTHLKATKE